MANGLIIRDQQSGVGCHHYGRRSGLRSRSVGAAAPRLLVAIFCLLPSVFCYAEELPDPTRPPAVSAAPGIAPGHGGESGRSSGLQTVIISESRRAAIIDGRTVNLGERHGNARLIEVNEGSVVLQGARGRKVLTLFPEVKISRKESPNPELPEMELPVEPASPASDALSGSNNIEPLAHEEKK